MTIGGGGGLDDAVAVVAVEASSMLFWRSKLLPRARGDFGGALGARDKRFISSIPGARTSLSSR